MKFLYSISLFMLSHLAVANSCNYLMMSTSVVSEITKLAEDVKSIPVVDFEKDFCAAIDACGNGYGMPMSIKAMKQQTLSILKNFPALVEEAEKKLKELKDGPLPESDLDKKFQLMLIKKIETRIAKLKDGLQKYEAYIKDPKSKLDPNSAMEGYQTLPTIKSLKSSQDMMESYYKNLSYMSKAYEQNIIDLTKSLEDLKKSEKPSQSGIDMIQKTIDMILNEKKKYQDQEKTYQEYLKDPIKNDLPNPYEGMSGFGVFGKNPTDKSNWYGTDEEDDAKDAENAKRNECLNAKNIYQSVASQLNDNKSGTCGMKPEELVAIKFYSDSGYGCMNTQLRKKKEDQNPKLTPLLKFMDSGLAKIPSYQGLVRRGGSLPVAVREQHKVGTVVKYDAYTSTSTQSGFNGTDMFMMYSKQGKPIMGFSSHSGEYEVLFPAGTQFKVLDVSSKNGINYYVMKEVSSDITPEEEKAADKALIEALKGKSEMVETPAKDQAPVFSPYSGGNPDKDTWSCPLDEKEALPKFIPQKYIPAF